jgi:hypothetical protein
VAIPLIIAEIASLPLAMTAKIKTEIFELLSEDQGTEYDPLRARMSRPPVCCGLGGFGAGPVQRRISGKYW